MFINIIYIILLALIIWFFLDQEYYSPKARLKRLWKIVNKLSIEINKTSSGNFEINSAYLLQRNKVGKYINSILEYYFDPENDEEYMAENKYWDEYTQNEEFVKTKVKSLLIQKEDWDKIKKLLDQ